MLDIHSEIPEIEFISRLIYDEIKENRRTSY